MLKLKKVLVVVADSSKAQFYMAHGPNVLINLAHMQHPESRHKDHDLTTKEHDVNTFPYENKNSKQNHEKQNFSREVVAGIEKYLKQEAVNDVCIFAPSKFMGTINKHNLSKNVKITEVAKDLTHAATKVLQKAIVDTGMSFLSSA